MATLAFFAPSLAGDAAVTVHENLPIVAAVSLVAATAGREPSIVHRALTNPQLGRQIDCL